MQMKDVWEGIDLLDSEDRLILAANIIELQTRKALECPKYSSSKEHDIIAKAKRLETNVNNYRR